MPTNYYEDTMNNALVNDYYGQEKITVENLYRPRLNCPDAGNPYYNTPAKGGYSTARLGNWPDDVPESSRTGYPGLNVLKNCVGYALGRFNEIGQYGYFKYVFTGNAWNFCNSAKAQGFSVGTTPALGAIVCWGGGTQGYGHVAVVEQINPDGSITTSESGWSSSRIFTTVTRYAGTNNNWIKGCDWQANGNHGTYWLNGFIYNPAVPLDAKAGPSLLNTTNPTDLVFSPDPRLDGIEPTLTYPPGTDPRNLFLSALGLTPKSSDEKVKIEYEDVTKEVEVKKARSVDYAGVLNQTKRASLLTYPTNVESPFVLLKVGEYTFGTYNTRASNNRLYVTYPNFIQGLEVTKINGRLNQYIIQLVYQIQKGNDPNLIDKIFGSVGYGKVKISYGDWNAPTLIYKEEEAIITKLDSNVDFASAKIIYTLYCTSTAFGLISSSYNFEAGLIKPSDKIKEILSSSLYGLNKVFTGMQNSSEVARQGWIASNDKAVWIEAKHMIDPLSYINYLVSCMVCESNSDDTVLLNSSYYMTLHDDAYGEYGGPYFTVKQIYSNSKTINNQDVYEVDIGYPSDAMVMSFNIRDNNSWSLLYNYNDELQKEEYSYDIDNRGNVITNYSPAFSTSSKNFITTPSQKNWWTQMTKFPISATLEIKGLVRPAMLMSYVKVNAFFYGQRHISSGIYFVTKQVDKVDRRGYRTVLSLTRFAGDEDYIATEKETVNYRVAKVVSTDKEVGAKNITSYQSEEVRRAGQRLNLITEDGLVNTRNSATNK